MSFSVNFGIRSAFSECPGSCPGQLGKVCLKLDCQVLANLV